MCWQEPFKIQQVELRSPAPGDEQPQESVQAGVCLAGKEFGKKGPGGPGGPS